MSQFEQHSKPAYTHSGPNVIDHLYDYLRQEEKEICKILDSEREMRALTAEEEVLFDSSTSCEGCKHPYSDKNPKVHHHCHITGEYIGPYCCNCNLQLKYRRSGSFSGSRSYNIPVVAHNMRSYDSHFLIT